MNVGRYFTGGRRKSQWVSPLREARTWTLGSAPTSKVSRLADGASVSWRPKSKTSLTVWTKLGIFQPLQYFNWLLLKIGAAPLSAKPFGQSNK